MSKLTKRTLLAALACLTIATTPGQSRADEDAAFEVKRNAGSWGRAVVRKFYDGGIDVETKVLDYAYSKKRDILWVKLSISFRGIFSKDVYRVVGEYEKGPKKSTWKHTSMNTALRDWFILKGVTKVGLKLLEDSRKK